MKKRLIALALSGALAITSLAGCSSGTDTAASSGAAAQEQAGENGGEAADGEYDHKTAHDTIKIGVSIGEMSNEALERIEYLTEYIAPYYNVEFIVSEALSSAEAELNFVENAAISGAVGILSFAPTYYEQVGNKCEELGLYYCVQRTADTSSIDGLQYFCGGFGAKQSSSAAEMKKAAEKFLSDGEKHGILIPTLLACQNNTAHREYATAIMEAVQEAYDLTFEQPIADLVVTGEPMEVANDKGIDIYLYPGQVSDEKVITGISAALLTGKYDIVMGAGNVYMQLSQIIDEAERSFNKNIMVASVGELSESLHTAMNTDDCTGNKALDYAVVKSTTVIAGEGFAVLMNGILGDMDVIKPDGTAMKYEALNWGCDGADGLATIEQLDQGADSYVFNYEVIDSLIKKTNPELTNEMITETLNSLTLEKCLENLGLSEL